MNILLIDDEPDFLDLMSKRLGRRGVNLTTAMDGEQGLASAVQGDFDVIILDVRMPGMDGIEVLRRLRKQDVKSEVLLLTGHASLEAARQGLELGAFDYLIKPVSINDLLFKLQDACEQHRLKAGKPPGRG
ncbi:response regulator [Desulfocurvus sp. DL9XJH121]